MFKTILKLSLIGTSSMLMSSNTILPAIEPLTLIAISIIAFPQSKSILLSISPTTLIYLSIIPLKSSLSLTKVIFKMASIYSIISHLHSSCFWVLIKNPFEDAILSNKQPISLSYVGGILPEIDSIFIWYDLKTFFCYKFGQVKTWIYWLVILNKLFIFVFGWNMKFFILSNSNKFAAFRKSIDCQSFAEFSKFTSRFDWIWLL